MPEHVGSPLDCLIMLDSLLLLLIPMRRPITPYCSSPGLLCSYHMGMAAVQYLCRVASYKQPDMSEHVQVWTGVPCHWLRHWPGKSRNLL